MALLAFASSGCTQAARLSRSIADHCSPVTFAAHNPVERLNIAMSRRCGGNSFRRRLASSLVKKRIRRVGSLNIRTDGLLSSHFQSRSQRRRMARIRAIVLFTVALLQLAAHFASAMRSNESRLIESRNFPPRCASSHRNFDLSSSAVALCACSWHQRITASFQSLRGDSLSFCWRQASFLKRSWSSVASALLLVSELLRIRSPDGVVKSIHQTEPLLRMPMVHFLSRKSPATPAGP